MLPIDTKREALGAKQREGLLVIGLFGIECQLCRDDYGENGPYGGYGYCQRRLVVFPLHFGGCE